MKKHDIPFRLLIFIFTVPVFEVCIAAKDVFVRTKNGNIRGTEMAAPPMAGSAIRKVNQFVGIPFAAPPVGELRFKPPQPSPAWKPNTYDATHFGKVCIQEQKWLDIRLKPEYPNFGKANYSEDCLYLNVYAPAQNDSLNQNLKYPVMVYIHGGSFISGTAVLSPGLALPTFGVVLVTIQYRLGPFGFLSTGDSVSPGNYGMLDQVQALKWVKENIEMFGGDSSKVTIFGLSAGGASVGLHLLSPLSKHLFHRAISESGVDLSSWSTTEANIAVTKAKELAKKVKCEDDELYKIIECMKKKDAWIISDVAGNSWKPTVDLVAGADAFLPDTPQNLRQAGKFQKLPYMVGFVPNEGAYFLPDLGNVTVNLKLFKNTIGVLTMTGLNVTNNKELTKMIREAVLFQYTPWGNTADPLKLRQGIVDHESDRWFLASSVLVCKIHSMYAPTYIYEFDYQTTFPLSPRWMGVTHADNFIFEFGFPFLNLTGFPPYSAADKNVSHLVMLVYTNFAKLGNPTPEPLSGIQWKAFNSTNLAYLHIDVSTEMRSNYKPRRMAFWNEYLPELMTSARVCNASSEKPSAKGTAKTFCPFPVLIFFLVLEAMVFVIV